MISRIALHLLNASAAEPLQAIGGKEHITVWML